MKRKDFLRALPLTYCLASSPLKAAQSSAPEAEADKIKPPRLKSGARIGLIAPGSCISEKELLESVENLKKLGFEPVYTDNVLARHGYLAGKDEVRAHEVNSMFARQDVDAIMCVRGGYGCARILNMLDYRLIRENPKILIGYSDITSLLYAINNKTGLTVFHGPVSTSTFNEFSLKYLKSVLMAPSERVCLSSSRDENAADKPVTIRSGKATGELVGGNLSIVASLIGTPHDIASKGKILFLEEISEEPYRIDRMLTQLLDSGKFDGVRGIALGNFTKCEHDEKSTEFLESLSLMEVLYDRLYDLGVPVAFGLSFGHIVNKFTLPFGINAELDADNLNINLLEPAVL